MDDVQLRLKRRKDRVWLLMIPCTGIDIDIRTGSVRVRLKLKILAAARHGPAAHVSADHDRCVITSLRDHIAALPVPADARPAGLNTATHWSSSVADHHGMASCCKICAALYRRGREAQSHGEASGCGHQNAAAEW